MRRFIQITAIILIALSLFCANVSEASSLLPGVSLHKVNDSIVVRDIKRESTTWKIGIRIGDIILKINDHKINTLDDYVKKTRYINSNEIVTLRLSRNDKEYVIIKDGNNYYRKSNAIEQNEKINITDYEVSTEKQSVSNNDIKRDTHVLPETKVPKFTKSDTVKGLLAVLGVLWLGIVIFSCYKSFRYEVIFFDNFFDLFIATFPIWILIISFVVAMFGDESVVGEVAGVVILYTFKYGFIFSGVYNLVVPFVFNRSTPILAFCVMVSRQLLVVIAPFLMFFVMIFGYGAIQRKGESNDIFAFRNELSKFRALAIFSAVAFFMIKLINGDRVRDHYGFRPRNQRRRKRKDNYSYESGYEKNDNQFDSYDDSGFDPCEILEISRTDSSDVNKVKEAYHNLSRKYHPDKVMHLGEKFSEMATKEMKTINEAYRILVKDESDIQNIIENDNPKPTSNINHPDIGPGLFDVTVEAWLFRISKWGKLNFRYQEPGTLRKKTITRAKFEMLLTDEGLIRAHGGWTNDWIAVNKLEIFRTYQNVEGKKVTERLFVTIDLNPEIKEAFR